MNNKLLFIEGMESQIWWNYYHLIKNISGITLMFSTYAKNLHNSVSNPLF